MSFKDFLVGQTVKCLPTMWETQVRFLGQEYPLEKDIATHSSFLPGKSHGQRSMVVYSPWGSKESDTTERLHFLVLQGVSGYTHTLKCISAIKSK